MLLSVLKETFLDNDLDLSVKWLAIRDMPFYEFMRKRVSREQLMTKQTKRFTVHGM